MRRVLGALGVCVLAAATRAPGSDVLREISWGGLQGEEAVVGGEVKPPDPSATFEHLVVTNADSHPRTVRLLTLRSPGITRSRYAITGEVRHADVEGDAYLEMWSTIPDRGRFFSRTLAPSGPMKSLSGSSPWRAFRLDFDASGGAPPSFLDLNLVLPGRATVWLGPLRLEQYAEAEAPTSAGAWWSARAAGLGGAVFGSFVGGLGALVGVLAQRGKGRALSLGLLKAMLAFGVAATGLGVMGLLRSQPYEVVYPLLLLGILCGALGGFLMAPLRRRYEEIELRKMRSLDVAPRT